MLPIATPRLLLRPLLPEDAQTVAVQIGNWNVIRWLAMPPFPYALADAEAFIVDTHLRGLPRAAIARDGALIGIVSIEPGRYGPELGYWLGEPFWGNGYMSEAAGALTAHFFATTTEPALYSGHLEDNAPSARVLAKLGFEPTGHDTMFSRAQNRELPHVKVALSRARHQILNAEGSPS